MVVLLIFLLLVLLTLILSGNCFTMFLDFESFGWLECFDEKVWFFMKFKLEMCGGYGL